MGYQLESQKSELLLSLNTFDKPAEVTGVKAWTILILHLLYTKKGSIPSNPLIGIGIQDYEYSFINETKSKLQSDINEQVRVFLPDIPLSSVEIKSEDVNGEKVLFLIFQFKIEDMIETAVVASNVTNNIINFSIAM